MSANSPPPNVSRPSASAVRLLVLEPLGRSDCSPAPRKGPSVCFLIPGEVQTLAVSLHANGLERHSGIPERRGSCLLPDWPSGQRSERGSIDMLQGWSSCVVLIGSPPQGLGFRSKVTLGFLTGKLEDPEMILHSRDDIS